MWHKVADFLLRFRIALLVLVLGLTAVMGYFGTKAEIIQEYVRVIPEEDPDLINYERFKKLFGADNGTIIVAVEADDPFTPARLNALHSVGDRISRMEGVLRVLSPTNAFSLKKANPDSAALATADSATAAAMANRLELHPLWPGTIQNQAQADSFRTAFMSQPVYQDLLLDSTRTTLLFIINMDSAMVRKKAKHQLMNNIQALVDSAANATGMKAHFSGMPYVRSYTAQKLPKELAMFCIMALVLTAITLFAFYRSVYAVIFPLILLAISGVFTFGIVGLLGYKITLIMALLPPIIIILGIPPSIYMLSDYHHEYKRTGDKIEALRAMVRRLGLVTFMINANTAFSFLTLYFTSVVMLQEFGLVAFLSTLASYFLAMILIPGLYGILPPPSDKHMHHLDSKFTNRLVGWMDRTVMHNRKLIYGITGVVIILALVGCWQLKAVSYMADDLPSRDAIMTDLRLLEDRFGGVMPFEIVIDTRKKQGLRDVEVLKKIDALQQRLNQYPQVSRSISIVDALKWSRQATFGGSPLAYKLPARDELPALMSLGKDSKNADKVGGGSNQVLAVLVDPNNQMARITASIADIGSVETPKVIDRIQADLDSLFGAQPEPYVLPDAETESTTAAPGEEPGLVRTMITGATRTFLKANEYLIDNLVWSLLAAFGLIGLQMFVLFGSMRIMIISMIPNLIPLVVTAGIMGWFGVPLKPSTALIYEMAFGIAIDNTIHYLSTYRLYRRKGQSIREAASHTNRSTGVAIGYTSIVLFMGFAIFAPSAFGSTQAMGVLTSVTLFTATFSNLFLLPVLLVNFDRASTARSKAMIDEEA